MKEKMTFWYYVNSTFGTKSKNKNRKTYNCCRYSDLTLKFVVLMLIKMMILAAVMVLVHRWLRFRQTHLLCLLSNVFSVTTLIVKELLYIYKIQFSTGISKSVIIYTTLSVSTISNNIIKQYYGIIKKFTVLNILKKKQLSRTTILI